MSDNKKYYYIKLKEDFYDSEEMIILENMPDGYLYSNILIKLYLRSLKNQGKLMFKNRIPYSPAILAQVVRHSVGVVEKALNIFVQLGLIEKLDDGAIYMLDIQNYIGKSSSEADRQRDYYNRIKDDKTPLIEAKCKKPCKKPNGISTPDIDIDIELKKELDIDLKKEITKETHISIQNLAKNQSIKLFNHAYESWLDSRKSINKQFDRKIFNEYVDIKSKKELRLFEIAIHNYVEKYNKENDDTDYVKNLGTFIKEWKKYVDKEHDLNDKSIPSIISGAEIE